jgi:hypothetical protein
VNFVTNPTSRDETMTTSYPARYRDRSGEERTTIMNAGSALTMVVRGVRFVGNDFDGLDPEDVSDPMRLASFSFLHGNLSSCVVEAEIPVPVVTPDGKVNGLLTFELELGDPTPTGQMDRERLELRLAIGETTYSSDGRTGWFEDEMSDLQNKLPTGTFMKACFNCAFSDYSPYDHGLFGNMICFRAN